MDDIWELCNDDGFVYKRRKRQRQEPSSANGSNPEAEAQQRREQKKKILMSLREQYGREIQQWEGLFATLQQLKENSSQAEASLPLPTSSNELSALPLIREEEGICRPLSMDELLLQAEAQESILQDLLNFCDVAEASCKAQEEHLKQSFIDLPIWATPRSLMASFSEFEDGEDDCNNSYNA
ncbi:uncharacterized protein LOC131252991 isoform X2 [Magnolia sinica]|uniref:uncharacterized protein LOC131252991 isoform X2 n=1 Tax=Magnolia sinica TaxID=86752 RepID=UPI002657FAA7|nr:uncharacterized protein LOC131252991 isoform X2 [Magnolia sinica]